MEQPGVLGQPEQQVRAFGDRTTKSGIEAEGSESGQYAEDAPRAIQPEARGAPRPRELTRTSPLCFRGRLLRADTVNAADAPAPARAVEGSPLARRELRSAAELLEALGRALVALRDGM